jgi:LacI family transcriptional regulator
MSITIEDVSRHLGLSISTVSKALNGYKDISPNTRERVIHAARTLGYHPNRAAQSLRLGKTNKLGLLINSSIRFLNDYVSRVISGATLAAEQFGQNLTVYTKEVVDPEELRRITRAGEVDGLLLLFDPTLDAYDVLIAEKTPFVVFGRRSTHKTVSFVAPDNFQGARALTKHLIAQGHQRIGFMQRPELGLTNDDRFNGYQQGLAEAGIKLDPDLIVETHVGKRDGGSAMRKLLEKGARPTAVFATYDLMAADALKAAQELGLKVPDDVAIAGFDGLTIAQRTRPLLTTVQQPLGQMGQRAVELLMQRIADNTLAPIREIMPVELIVRDSTMKNN